MAELADVLDQDGKPTGEQKTKPEIFAAGEWCLATHVWVVDKSGRLLVQQRAKKGFFDDLWDVSIGGGVAAGEDSRAAAVRELAEELGLHLSPDQLQLAGRFKIPKFIPERGQYSNEYSDTYYAVIDAVNIAELTLEAREVVTVEWRPMQGAVDQATNPKTAALWVPHGVDYFRQVSQHIQEQMPDSNLAA